MIDREDELPPNEFQRGFKAGWDEAVSVSRAVNTHAKAVQALNKIAAMDPKGIRADDLGRAARIARDAVDSVVGGSTKP